MGAWKLVGLVILAGFTAGTIGQIVGNCEGNKAVKKAEEKKGVVK